jgi:hypothetical protein
MTPTSTETTLDWVTRLAERHRPWGTRWRVFSPVSPVESRLPVEIFAEEAAAYFFGFALWGVLFWVFWNVLPGMEAIRASTPPELTAAQNWEVGGVFFGSMVLGFAIPFGFLGLGRRAARQGLLNTAETRRVNELLGTHPVLVAPVARWVRQSPLTVGDLEEIESLADAICRAQKQAEVAAMALAARQQVNTLLHEGPLGPEIERNTLEGVLPAGGSPETRRL